MKSDSIKYKTVDRFYAGEDRRAAALKLGISEIQVEKIYAALKEKHPAYHLGYDYNSLLLFLSAHANEIVL